MSITFTAGILGVYEGEIAYECRSRITQAPEINVATANGAHLLDLLGLDLDAGECPAEDFAGRVLLAQALLDVATDDEHGTPTVADTRWTTFGRRPGYAADMLGFLADIATWAAKRNAVVVWS